MRNVIAAIDGVYLILSGQRLISVFFAICFSPVSMLGESFE